jgi:ABC-type antimicrobial peptide transport system permease subunit
MPLVVPWTQVAIAVGLALLASLVAAALPARRVARMPLAARIREQPL